MLGGKRDGLEDHTERCRRTSRDAGQWTEMIWTALTAERATNTPPPAPPSRFAQAQKTASGYIPNSVSATATSVGDRMKEGYDSLTTQQRKEQVSWPD